MQITIRVADQYGNKVFIPACDNAVKLAALAGTKTLTLKALGIIKELGIDVNVEFNDLMTLQAALNGGALEV